MTELKFYLLCFLIAAPQRALGSAAEVGWRFSPKSIAAPQGALGFAAEVFEKVLVDGRTYYPSVIRTRYGPTTDSDECFSKALIEGAQAVRLEWGKCILNFLTHPVCTQREGSIQLYVRKDFVTDGSPNDNAMVSLSMFEEIKPGSVVRTFRIESPTILEFGDLRNDYVPQEEALQYFATSLDGFRLVYSAHPAFVHPSCYTTSACSDVFLTTAPEIPESNILVIYDICGQSIQVDSGRSIYVLSHEGIGCKNFPNNYPVPDCWAEFTGAGEITIKVTFVNFRESDHCDGFTMTAVTDDANGSSTTTDLCDATAPTELTSAGGKVKIQFGGSASPTREKYGFDIQVTAA